MLIYRKSTVHGKVVLKDKEKEEKAGEKRTII